MVNFDSDYTAANAGTAMSAGVQKTYISGLTTPVHYDFDSGANSAALGTAEIATGHDLFEDEEAVEVDFLIAPGMGNRADQTTVTNDLVANAIARKDCIAVSSPARSDVVNVTNEATATTNIVATAATSVSYTHLTLPTNREV